MRSAYPLALIGLLFSSCLFATSQEAPAVRIGVTVLAGGTNIVSVTEARDRLARALNQQKPDKKFPASLEAVSLDAQSTIRAMAEAREHNCQFVLFTRLTDLTTTFDNSNLDGVNLPDFFATLEYRVVRVVDLSEFSIGSVKADDPISSREAIWKALTQVERRASAEIRQGKGTTAASQAEATASPVPEIPAVPSLVYTGNAHDYCKWLPPDVVHGDALRGACEYAISLRDKMPNFVCEKSTARYQGGSPAPIDLISALVRYEDGNESYSEVRVNGHAIANGSEENLGLRSTGEFAGNLRAVFDRSNHAVFRFTREDKRGEHEAWIFTYKIAEQKDPVWVLQAPNRIYAPPYSGELWIDAKDGIVLRFRSVANPLPPDFPMKSVDLEIDYDRILFGDGTDFVLPVDSTLINVLTDEESSRNVVHFRDCHKFRALARVVLSGAANSPGVAPEEQVLPALPVLEKDLQENEAIYAAIGEQSLRESELRSKIEQKQILDSLTTTILEEVSALPSARASEQTQAIAKTAPAIPDENPLTTLKVSVNLVLVSVVLRDAKGHAVGNLAQQNFQLMDDGKPQSITHFSVENSTTGSSGKERAADSADVQESAETASPEADSAPAARDTAYLFDDVHLDRADLAAAKDAAARYLTSLREGDRAALFTTSGAVVVDFTPNREQLLSGLRKLQPRAHLPENDCPPINLYMADLMEKGDSEAIGLAVAEASDCAMRGGPPGPHAAQLAKAKAMEVRNIGSGDSRDSLSVLRNVIRRIQSMPGQRSIVLVSPGFLAVSPDMDQDVMKIIDGAIRNGIIINTLDAGGLPTSGLAGSSGDLQFDMAEHEARTILMSEFASGTGGVFFHNNNDLDEGFRRTADAPEFVYVIGFAPQRLDGRFHKLKVSVKGSPKLTIQARQGYYALKATPGS